MPSTAADGSEAGALQLRRRARRRAGEARSPGPLQGAAGAGRLHLQGACSRRVTSAVCACDPPALQLETTGVLDAAEVLMQSIDILASKLKDIQRAIKAEVQGNDDDVAMRADEGLQGGYNDGY